MLKQFPILAREVQTAEGKACGWGMLHCAIQRKAPAPFLKDLLRRTARRRSGSQHSDDDDSDRDQTPTVTLTTISMTISNQCICSAPIWSERVEISPAVRFYFRPCVPASTHANGYPIQRADCLPCAFCVSTNVIVSWRTDAQHG
jgi:hypothetical protein